MSWYEPSLFLVTVIPICSFISQGAHKFQSPFVAAVQKCICVVELIQSVINILDVCFFTDSST